MLKTHVFPPSWRIRQRPDFQKMFRLSKRIYSPIYIAYYRSNERNHARLGVITSKRNVRKAVQRNRVKRMARETFRNHNIRLQSLDIVLVAQKKANESSKEELKLCLEKLFAKLIK